jgi:hypothetical protein
VLQPVNNALVAVVGSGQGALTSALLHLIPTFRICHSARFAKWIMRVVAQTIGDYIGVGVLIVD